MKICVDELPESIEECPFSVTKWEGDWVYYCGLSKEPLKCNFHGALNECRGVYTMPKSWKGANDETN